MEFQTNYNSVFFGLEIKMRGNTGICTRSEFAAPMQKLKNTNYYMPSVKETINSEQFGGDFPK